MKKILSLMFAGAVLFSAQTVFAGSSAGCGLGSTIFQGKDGLVFNVLAATTNGTSGNQTFGMTTGTLGCKGDDVVYKEKEAEVFVTDNYELLLNDAGRGNGEYVTTYASLMGCTDTTAFAKAVQTNSGSIFSSQDTAAVLSKTSDVIASDVALSQTCRKDCFTSPEMPKSLLLLGIFVFLSPFRVFSDYREDLTRTALTQKLYEQRYWHILLDYEPNLLGGYTSREDLPIYFLSPEGKTNPEAELISTLNAFFFPPEYTSNITGLHPKCQFTARYKWLKEQLNFDEAQMPAVTCTNYAEWLKNLGTDRVVMVFPSADIKIPASMFGHTLIRIDNSRRKEGNLLNYSVNFAASVNIEETNVLFYSVLGIFGGYDGMFSMYPYHLKVQEYNEIDQRDMWEYELNFSPEEIDRFMARLWELRNLNCICQIRFHLWTVPVDTVRILYDYPGTIKSAAFRPSRINRAYHMLAQLTGEETGIFEKLQDSAENTSLPEFQQLPDARKALILELLADYHLIRNKKEKRNEWRTVVQKRAGIGYKSPEVVIPAETQDNPVLIHKTSKVSVSAGANNSEKFVQFTLRAAYRDHLDAAQGFSPLIYYRLEFLKLSLRYYEQTGAVADEFKIVGIGNYSPMTLLDTNFSYNLDALLATVKQTGCYRCLAAKVKGDFGAAKLIGELNIYGVAGGTYSKGIDQGGFSYQAEAEVRLGAVHYGKKWNFHTEYGAHDAFAGEKQTYGRFFAGISYHAFEDTELRGYWEKTADYSEGRLEVGRYF
ncbi:hypothetical protein CHS0354_026786 [Potamilus streckersoni]|uniref:Uncharacterized protein n=1 Tax=Potamilus streckersoni TaxID=2493646 RepID=A0AAE0W8D1_9BIVA|nr:hypothetical protein CHS0354_026786 [Potamilus streckersoni]